MKGPVAISILTLSFLASALKARAAETGDFDGDGRLTLADLEHVQGGLAPAQGSMDGFDAHPCHGAKYYWTPDEFQGLTFLEMLRRNVPDPLPLWERIWTDSRPDPPLEPNDQFTVRIEPSMQLTPGSDELTLQLELTCWSPVRSFFLILESPEDVLRVHLAEPDYNIADYWSALSQHNLSATSHNFDDRWVHVTPPDSLVTRGRLVVTFSLGSRLTPLFGELMKVPVSARLSRGTRAGSYEVRVLPGSQVLFEDGTLAAPFVEGPGRIEVEEDVSQGWDEGIPPLRPNPLGARVEGKVEFRVVNAAEIPPEDGAPIAHANPGEELKLRVQLRTEVPLNDVYFDLRWPDGALVCPADPFATLLFTNPEDGRLYPPDKELWCYDSLEFGDGAHRVRFHQVGSEGLTAKTPPYVDRPFEYFKPLGEWTDLTELRLKVPTNARRGERIPLSFRSSSDEIGLQATNGRQPRAHFNPYGVRYPCDTTRKTDDVADSWIYDLTLHEAFIEVLGDGEPDPDPPDGGIRIEIGAASGRPGETIEVPIHASAVSRLLMLRLALELDLDQLLVEALAPRIEDRVNDIEERPELQRGERAFRVYCDDPDLPPDQRTCLPGVPVMSVFQATDDRHVLVDFLISSPDAVAYPGESLLEVARLKVRIRDDAQGVESVILPAVVTWMPGEFPVDSESGGTLYPDSGEFSPASSVRAGVITILGRGFLRGDANLDRKVDLSDAVATLGFLFLGTGVPACLDSADADDSGVVEITDPIFLLGALFLGTKTIPEPFPECGTDGTRDTLGCKEACP